MADIEKKILSDSSEHGDQKHHIDQKVSALEEKSADFIDRMKSRLEQEATKEVIAKLEHDESNNLSLDALNDNKTDNNQSAIVANSPNRQIANSPIARISSENPDSSPEANAGREQSYTTIQSQISTLPFGLGTFFADA